MANEKKKPVDFDQLYPGRFIKAGELQGKKVTLTIADVDTEELVGDDGKTQIKATLAFKETPKKHVCCKTNGICIREMFGRKIADWIGKRVTFYPDVWNGDPCIRVWGSPDIDREIPVTITLPRKRPIKKTMHPMGRREPRAEQPAEQPPPESRHQDDDGDDGEPAFA